MTEDLPYGGGRVLHSNLTHPIFWAPAGSGLTFDPGYESLIDTFLTDVAADSHKTTNTFSLTGQYHDSKGPAAYDSTYAGAVVDTDPLPPNGCTEPGPTGPGWTVCLTDAQIQTEIEQVVADNHLPTTGGNVYFMITPDGFGSCTGSRAVGLRSRGQRGRLLRLSLRDVEPDPVRGDPVQRGPPALPVRQSATECEHRRSDAVDDQPRADGDDHRPGRQCLGRRRRQRGGGPMPDLVRPDASAGEATRGGTSRSTAVTSTCRSCGATPATPASRGPSRTRCRSLLVHDPGRARMVAFTARGSDPQGRLVSFNWSFGDGVAAVGRRVSHMYRVPGPTG